MDTLKINPKILAAVFASVMIIADIVPAPNLRPGLIITSYSWVASQIQSPTDIHHADQELQTRGS